MNSPTPRKLRIPGKPVQLPAIPELLPPEPPPACVAPRRRFILRFLLITGLLTLLGNTIYYSRLVLAHAESDTAIFPLMIGLISGVLTMAMIEAIAFVFLLLPARTRRSSLLQLIGLVLPLLVAVAACAFSGAETDLGWGYGAFIALLSLYGMFFFHLPIWLLHLIISFIEKYHRKPCPHTLNRNRKSNRNLATAVPTGKQTDSTYKTYKQS